MTLYISCFGEPSSCGYPQKRNPRRGFRCVTVIVLHQPFKPGLCTTSRVSKDRVILHVCGMARFFAGCCNDSQDGNLANEAFAFPDPRRLPETFICDTTHSLERHRQRSLWQQVSCTWLDFASRLSSWRLNTPLWTSTHPSLGSILVFCMCLLGSLSFF